MSSIRLTGMVIWTILCITISMLIRIVTFSPNYSVAMARTIWGPVILWLAGIKLTVKGLENIPAGKQTYVVVANHQSVIDIPILFSVIPFNVYFIAKKEIAKVPFIGWYMHLMGMIFVDRGSREKAINSMVNAGKLIREGKNVMTFPEGTRSRDGKIGVFKAGTFFMAEQAGVDILPVKITGAGKIWPSGVYTITKGPVTVSIGAPISTASLNDATRTAFIEEVKGTVESL